MDNETKNEIWGAIDRIADENTRLNLLFQKIQGQIVALQNEINIINKRLSHHISMFDDTAHKEGRRKGE